VLLSNSQDHLRKIRSIADYQFRRGAGEALFPKGVTVDFSRTTKRIRFISLRGDLLATLRPTNGLFALTLAGGARLLKKFKPVTLRVIVNKDVEDVIGRGQNVFSKHVISADKEIRALDEVLVVNSEDTLLAVGRAILTGEEMLAFKRGIAAKIRRGIEEGNRE
jgi:predicted RNA-binding protein (TIGR00451 family)